MYAPLAVAEETRMNAEAPEPARMKRTMMTADPPAPQRRRSKSLEVLIGWAVTVTDERPEQEASDSHSFPPHSKTFGH